jgi:phenylacetic acid degradation operon negative regulatory protein
VLLSALLGESPPVLAVRRLVRVAQLFGINDNQARVALSRMAARGEVVADQEGNYALGGRLLERASRLAAARRAVTAGYDGRWHVVVVTVTGDDAATRRARRAALRALRLGELRDGTWVRPANLEVIVTGELAGSVRCFSATPRDDDAALAREVFDLEGWARRARHLLGVLDAVATDGADSLATGFELDAEVLRHLQRDPLVPEVLLDGDWPGAQLRARYEAFDADYRRRLAAAHRTLAASST